MWILITNFQLDHRTGTEIVVRDLECGLRAAGHEVCVYTPNPGVLSNEIIARGGTVVTDVRSVPFRPDVIHAHHNVPAIEAALHFPGVPLVFVCHDRRSWLDMTAGIPSVREHVAVDLNCRERLIAEGVPADSIHIVPNAVDLSRMQSRDLVSIPPRRAAVFANNAVPGVGFAEHVRTACAAIGLELDVFGSGAGTTLDDPESRLAGYDVVFAKARCAIEALAAGCAVIAVDAAGYGGLVTAANVEWMLDWNVGDRCLQRRHDAAEIERDLLRIDADDVRVVRDVVTRRCDLRATIATYERIYGMALNGAGPDADTDPVTWRDSYGTVATYASELEARLRAGDGAWSMPPLPQAAAEAVEISVVAGPRHVEPGATFDVEVEVDNRSRENLATIGATPVQWSYHWTDDLGEMVVFEGGRTPLVRAVRPGDRLRQRVVVSAPERRGRFRLQVTMVQETVVWFTHLPTPVYDEWPMVLADQRDDWTLTSIADLLGLPVRRDARVANLGFVSSGFAEMLTFALTTTWITRALRGGASALLVPPALADLVPDGIGLIESGAPERDFRLLHDALLAGTDFYGTDVANSVHPTARIHPTAVIDDMNIVIAEGADIGAGVVLRGRVSVGRRVVVHPGAVIGAAGLQTMADGDQRVELRHVGGVTIGDDAVLFANTTVARGVFRQNTVIGDSCRIGNNAFVSHNTRLGRNTTVAHGAVINGNVAIGEDVWIGPNATVADSLMIGDRCRINLGATVIGSLRPDEHVGGPPAIDHRTVLREVARWRSRRAR